uniref:Uncharacterized protein n=1 Tax=Trichobilharzia regenti TaxID=157069 RepID=A0AA85KJ69_TRIRE|nr:unnamed protein product [Trichobilharzia regenti]
MKFLLSACLFYAFIYLGTPAAEGKAPKVRKNGTHIITDWSGWQTVKEYNISESGGKREKKFAFTLPPGDGWEVMTEFKTDEVVIPRSQKVTKRPAKKAEKPKPKSRGEEIDEDKSKAEVHVVRRIRVNRNKKQGKPEEPKKEAPKKKKAQKKPPVNEDGEEDGDWETVQESERDIHIGRRKKGEKNWKKSSRYEKEVRTRSKKRGENVEKFEEGDADPELIDVVSKAFDKKKN